MSKQTNKWALAGVALAEALRSDEYSVTQTVYMCDVIDRLYNHGEDSHAGYLKHMAYTELWEALSGSQFFGLSGSQFFGLLELLVNNKVIPSVIVSTNGGDLKRALRLKVGLAFWSAVAKHISTGNPNIRSIRRVGYDAVRELHYD